jgi:hypothetical protein
MRIAIVPLIVLSLSLPAQAQPEMLTLVCQGAITTGREGTPEPISMGVTISFTTLTVHGFGGTSEVKITYMDETIIAFEGLDPVPPNQLTHWDISGRMHRLTGDMEVTSTLFFLNTGTIGSLVSYSLKCKPAVKPG